MDLFRTPGIGPALPPRAPSQAAPTFGPGSTRRYGRYRSVRPTVSVPHPFCDSTRRIPRRGICCARRSSSCDGARGGRGEVPARATAQPRRPSITVLSVALGRIAVASLAMSGR